MIFPRIPLSAIMLGMALSLPVAAQQIEEAPSTVDARYVAESAVIALKPGEKIERLYNKNVSQDYVLQKLTDRVYFFQSQFYGSIFYVGDEGVLLFDALEGRADALRAAIAEVTDLPVTAIVYSHNHADHIADTAVLAGQFAGLRIIASERTAAQMERLGSKHPAPTEIVKDDAGTFSFEDLVVRIAPLFYTGHAHDHAIFVLEGTGVIHLPDLINPDQPPFWSFAGAESYLNYRTAIQAVSDLEWDYLSGGHGNVGSKDDVAFYNRFLDDLEIAVGQGLGNVAWGAGVENPESLNAHTAYLSNWITEVGKYATDQLRPEYGVYYGFEYATPKNAELVAWAMFEYR